MSSPNPIVRSVSLDWNEAALRRLGEILFRTSFPFQRSHQIDTFVDLLHCGRLQRENVLLAFGEGDSLAGVILAEPMAGAAGNLWPPQVIALESVTAIEDTLVRAALGRLRLAGIKSIQSFLTAEELPAGESLLRNGFRHLTRVWSMKHEVGPPEAETPATEFVPVTSITLSTLIDTLVRTYEGSLDCPELNDVRTRDEVREGLLSSAPDLNLWWLLRTRGENVGALILTREGDRQEINYLGVVPGYRRAGVATDAVRFSLRQAAGARTREVTLLVDARNQPAIRLYRRHGFKVDDSREVFLLGDE